MAHPATNEAIPIRRRKVDVHGLLVSVLEVLVEQAKQGDVELTLKTAAGTPHEVSIDPEKIAWAITTLVGNALRYVRHGSRRLPGGIIHVSARYESAYAELVLAVSDDGPGIPARQLERLFEPHEGRIHAAGLSLSLIDEVARAHGGSLAVKSDTEVDQHGTTFTMRIPVG